MDKCKHGISCSKERFNIVYEWRKDFSDELEKFVKQYVRDNERSNNDYVELPERIFSVADVLGEEATHHKIIFLTCCFNEKVTPDHLQDLRSWTSHTQKLVINNIKDEFKLQREEMN